jgi:selenocysteine lyase/cysteine desulfurase
MDGVNSQEIGEYLGDKGLYVWTGNFYAVQIVDHVLGLEEQGGLVRIGLAPYNIESEIDRLLEAVEEFAATKVN